MVIFHCRVRYIVFFTFAEALSMQDLLRSWALEDNFGCALADWQIDIGIPEFLVSHGKSTETNGDPNFGR